MRDSSNGFNKLQIGLSTGSHFLVDIYQSFYVGLIPILTLKFGLSLFQVSLIGATSMIANSLFSPFFGYLSDRHGLKYYIVAGPLVSALLLSTLGILPSYYLLLVFLFIGNLGIAAYHPASAAIAGHYGGKNKGLGSSIINFGGNFGNSLGSLLIILILEKIGMEYTPLTAIPGLIITFILLRWVPSSGTVRHRQHIDFFGKIKGSRRLKTYLLSLIFFTNYSLYVVWITLVNYMPLYFTQSNISLVNMGLILFLFGGLGGAGGLIFGYIFDRHKKGSFIMQSGLLIGAASLFLTFRTSGMVSIILFILAGTFLIPVQPVCIRMAQDLLPYNMSLASSLILGLAPGVAGITIIFLGKIADKTGIVALINYELPLLILSTLLLFSFPFIENKLEEQQAVQTGM